MFKRICKPQHVSFKNSFTLQRFEETSVCQGQISKLFDWQSPDELRANCESAAGKLCRHIRAVQHQVNHLAPVLESYVNWGLTGGYNQYKISNHRLYGQSRSSFRGSYHSDFTSKIFVSSLIAAYITEDGSSRGVRTGLLDCRKYVQEVMKAANLLNM